MRLIKDTILAVNPNALFISSRANEKNTDEDIFKMGHNLAQELD